MIKFGIPTPYKNIYNKKSEHYLHDSVFSFLKKFTNANFFSITLIYKTENRMFSG